MSIGRRASVLLLFLALLGCSAYADTLRWHMSFEYAKGVAKRTGRLLMVEIYAVGVSSGRRFTRETYPDPRVVRAASNLVLVRIDGTREGVALVQRYGVRVMSTILFLRPDGSLVHRVAGFCDARTLVNEINKADGAARDREAYIARYKQNPRNWETAVRLASIYAYELKPRQSIEMLTRAEKLRPSKDSYLFAEAYNAIGDYFQVERRFEQAISFFRKASAIGRRADDTAYAQISIGTCYLAMREYSKMGPELQRVLELPGASVEDRSVAKQLIQSTYRSSGGFPKGRR